MAWPGFAATGPDALRVLFCADAAYAEPGNGAGRSMATLMEWLAAAGHSCHAVTTGRFELPNQSIRAQHDQFGAIRIPGPRATARYRRAGVEVVAVETLHPNAATPDPAGGAPFRAALAQAVAACPDLVLAYGGDPLVHAALGQARRQGARTVFTLHAWGYEDRRWFTHADRVLAASPFLARAYRARIGLQADGIPPLLDWSVTEAPAEARGFVTFVNPSLHKGAALFARLADMLGRRRPDIPMLIVQSGQDASALAAIPGLDLARYPQILVSPCLPQPRDVFALARILLVPSLFEEPFGRIAAEAMIAGVPPLVSDRGALPGTVGDGGIVLPVPAWMDAGTRRIPDEAELEHWFDAVVALWDDQAHYAAAAGRARAAASRLYAEADLHARYLDAFTGPCPPLFPGR